MRVIDNVCAIPTAIMVHAEQVAELVGDDEGGGKTVLADEDATSRGIANTGDRGIARWPSNILSEPQSDELEAVFKPHFLLK